MRPLSPGKLEILPDDIRRSNEEERREPGMSPREASAVELSWLRLSLNGVKRPRVDRHAMMAVLVIDREPDRRGGCPQVQQARGSRLFGRFALGLDQDFAGKCHVRLGDYNRPARSATADFSRRSRFRI